MILDSGVKIPIFLDTSYGTDDYSTRSKEYYSETGTCNYGINWGRGTCPESKIFGIKKKYDIGFETTVYSDSKFIIKTLVLPEDTQRLVITFDVVVIDPITLPLGVRNLTFSKNFTITNIEEFTYRDDVVFQISNRR